MSSAAVHEISHPLIAHHLSVLRDVATPPPLFRLQIQRLSMLLAVEASRDLPMKARDVQTPLKSMEGMELAVSIAIVPILRAGLGMIEPVLQLIPDAEVWHLGMYRDEQTAMPVEYYCKLPPGNPSDVGLVLDPMLATGGSIRAAASALKRWGVQDIRVLSIIATQHGIDRLLEEHPDVQVWVAKIDPELNAHKFIVPGLGDAGDRIFNTRSS